jgi:hypothetical protein
MIEASDNDLAELFMLNGIHDKFLSAPKNLRRGKSIDRLIPAFIFRIPV